MSRVVRISADVFERLQKHAEPLVDTPADVIGRLLDSYEGRNGTTGKDVADKQEPKMGNQTSRFGGAKNGIERSRNGTLTDSFLKRFLLAVLSSSGNRAETRQALRKMRGILEERGALHNADLVVSSDKNGWERWETNTRFARKHLVDDGLLKDTLAGERGWWELTDKGRTLASQYRKELDI